MKELANKFFEYLTQITGLNIFNLAPIVLLLVCLTDIKNIKNWKNLEKLEKYRVIVELFGLALTLVIFSIYHLTDKLNLE